MNLFIYQLQIRIMKISTNYEKWNLFIKKKN